MPTGGPIESPTTQAFGVEVMDDLESPAVDLVAETTEGHVRVAELCIEAPLILDPLAGETVSFDLAVCLPTSNPLGKSLASRLFDQDSQIMLQLPYLHETEILDK